jgi:peroxiredoxin
MDSRNGPHTDWHGKRIKLSTMKTLLAMPLNLRLVGRRLLFWSGVLGLTLALWGCSGDRAPESIFVLLDGSKITSKQLHGKVALVNFWATSCTTCVAEMPELVATYNKFKDRGYVTLAVAMSYDPPSYVVNFAQSRQLPFGVAIDNTGTVAREWGDIKLTPTTFLVNKQGEIVKRFVGTPDFAELHKLIEKLLAET